MLGRRGQAFDAFKLLIAAVVAGAILVIILSMLSGFTKPGGDLITVSAQIIQQIRDAPHSGMVSQQIVQVRKGRTWATDSIESKAGVNAGRVKFCFGSHPCGSSDACPKIYWFNNTNNTNYFDKVGGSDNQIEVKNNVNGRVWVYNCDGVYYVGFIPE